METTFPPSQARRNVAVLVAAQALLGAQMPAAFILGPLAGQSLAPNPCLATLPISLIVFGSMTSAPFFSGLMQTRGRATGFTLGALCGAAGAAVAAAGLWAGSFGLFLVGSYLTGLYLAAQGFFRFAAADTASEAFRPKAISYVMAGGLVSALVGPSIVSATNDALGVPFMGTYLALIALNLASVWLFTALRIPRPPKPGPGPAEGRTRREMLRNPAILVAVICAMVSYALMNLVMTSTPLAMVGVGHSTDQAASVVGAHVMAMYAPSFFTGHLVARFGVRSVMGAGLALLAAAGLTALNGVTLGHFFATLMLLGLGWNFGFIGATTMLTQTHTPAERGRIQGLNDALVFGCVTLASLASGGLLNCSGGTVLAGWTAVNLAMIPFLALAGGALLWLGLTRRRAARA